MGAEKRSFGEETVRIAENSMGIVWKNDELRGKNIETKRDVAEELRVEWWRKSLERQSIVSFWKGEGIVLNGEEWLGNSTVAIGFAEEPD